MENVTGNITESTSVISQSVITWTSILTGIVLYTIVAVTICGNVLVLVAVAINKNLQTTFNYYVVNLAITDLAVALTAMSFYTMDNMLGYWPFGEFLCGVWIFFDYGMTFMSVFTLILISVDRFWSVTWSVHYRRHRSKKKTLIATVFIWLFMLALWLPPCIYDRIYHAEPGICIWEPSLNTGFVVVVATIGHHGSCIIILFCYLKVFMFMYRRRRIIGVGKDGKTVMVASDSKASTLQPGCSTSWAGKDTSVSAITSETASENKVSYGKTAMPNIPVFVASEGKVSSIKADRSAPVEDQSNTRTKRDTLEVPIQKNNNPTKTRPTHAANSEKLRRQKRERAVFITLTYVIVGYAVCWIPFHVVFDISSVCPSCVPGGIYTMSFWMAYFNSTINPFLYNFSTPEFKETFKRILRRR